MALSATSARGLGRLGPDRPSGCAASTTARRPAALPGPARASRDSRRPVVCRARDSSPGLPSRLRVGVPKSRAPAEAPAPIAIVHSSTYTRREDLGSQDDGDSKPVALAKKESSRTKDSDDAFKVVLARADENLASFDENPPQAAKAFWDVAYGPVGKAATRSLQGAAKATVAMTKEAVKAGAPAAKWAVKEGAKAAISLVVNSGKKTEAAKAPKKSSK